MTDKISVIIPVYNAEKYISDCLESVVRQTYKNLEILLVDDGSKDGSAGICLEWCKRMPESASFRKKTEGFPLPEIWGCRKHPASMSLLWMQMTG